MGIRLFNCRPLKLKQLYNDVKYYKIALKECSCCHSSYMLEEYFEYSDRNDMFVPWWYVVRTDCKCIICVILVLLNICFVFFFCFYMLFACLVYKHISTAFIHIYCMTFPHSLNCNLYEFMEIKADSDSDSEIIHFGQYMVLILFI
jgi:hypothetical protein